MSSADQMVDQLADQLSIYASNFKQQLHGAFDRMTPERYVQLFLIVCAYILFRPRLLKIVEWLQGRNLERELDPNEARGMQRAAKNVVRDPRDGSLRERIDVPEDTDSDSGGEEKPVGTDWGKKARRRQRRVVRTLLEQEEQRKWDEQGADSDKEIEDRLID